VAEVCSVSAPAPAPGGEVRAFNGLGAFAVGVDLEPVDTAFVVNGNAMKLQWPDGCVDAIYTNVFDHLPSLDAIAKEVARLLKPGGIFFGDVEAQFRKMDSWAVRDTGTGAFYAELATAMAATNVMRHCYTHELYANRSGGSRSWDMIVWQRTSTRAIGDASDTTECTVSTSPAWWAEATRWVHKYARGGYGPTG